MYMCCTWLDGDECKLKFVLHGDGGENEAQKRVHQPAQEAEEGRGDRAHRHLNATHDLGEDHLRDSQGEVDGACDLVPQAVHQAQDQAQRLLSDGDDGCDTRCDVDAVHVDAHRSLVLNSHADPMHRHHGGQQDHADERALRGGRHLIARSNSLNPREVLEL